MQLMTYRVKNAKFIVREVVLQASPSHETTCMCEAVPYLSRCTGQAFLRRPGSARLYTPMGRCGEARGEATH